VKIIVKRLRTSCKQEWASAAYQGWGMPISIEHGAVDVQSIKEAKDKPD
jgi:hypothetical protein